MYISAKNPFLLLHRKSRHAYRPHNTTTITIIIIIINLMFINRIIPSSFHNAHAIMIPQHNHNALVTRSFAPQSALSRRVAQAVYANHIWSVVASRVVYPRACDPSCNPYYILVTPIT